MQLRADAQDVKNALIYIADKVILTDGTHNIRLHEINPIEDKGNDWFILTFENGQRFIVGIQAIMDRAEEL
jgi:hypothetical protein